jgi:thioredoxin-related protein
MNSLKLTGVLTILTVFVIGLAYAAETPEKDSKPAPERKGGNITWLGYDEGLAKAKAEDKHLFVNFTTSWCGFCKKMNRTTFVDGDVVSMMDSNFVAVMVDGDSKYQLDIEGYRISERDLTRGEFKVASYPTYFFLKPDGEKLGALRGYQVKDQLMKYLAFVAERQYDTTATKEGSKN